MEAVLGKRERDAHLGAEGGVVPGVRHLRGKVSLDLRERVSEVAVDDGDGGVCGTYLCPEMISGACLVGEVVSTQRPLSKEEILFV